MRETKTTKVLRAIAEKPAKELTAADKETVRKAIQKYGVQFEIKEGCPNCWNDAAMMCLIAIQNEQAKTEATADERRYILRPNVDVYFGKVRVNEATLTDKLAERLISRGFDTKFFVKCG